MKKDEKAKINDEKVEAVAEDCLDYMMEHLNGAEAIAAIEPLRNTAIHALAEIAAERFVRNILNG